MAAARQVVTLGRAARADAKLKVRQPLPHAFVLVPGATWSDEVLREIADELNVKRVDAVTDLEGLLDVAVVPNFRALGQRLGPKMPLVKAALLAADGAEIRRAFERDGSYSITIDGESVTLAPDDVEIRAVAHESLAVVQDGPVAVALDTTVTEDLRREGRARELVRALNDHRKALGLDLSDRIRVTLRTTGDVAEAALEHGEWIAAEVLAVKWTVEPAPPAPNDTILTIDGTAVGITLETATA
jgi:isoleucyl-tRNA synthetase